MRNTLFIILAFMILPWTCEGKENTANKESERAGVVIAHSRGLHGYIGYSASRPPDRATYSAGMGFYSAVWPLIAEPIADFQIGLPSAWITPDNSDNKVPRSLRLARLQGTIGRSEGLPGVAFFRPWREVWAIGPAIDSDMDLQSSV